ncbi:MAG: AAA family ATPase, partial [Bacteroidota bacterium]|nr:AAA family ATPase [Bacteroidota bacterium]
YVLQDKGGKFVPEKIGLAAVQREDVSYEFFLMFDLDQKHNATASKDRTGLFMDKPPFIITEATGQLIKQWCENGIKINDIESQIEECTTIDGLRHILVKYPEYRKRLEPSAVCRKGQIEALSTAVNR